MPYIVASVLRANEFLSRLDGFEPDALLAAVGDADSVLAGVERLGLLEVLEPGDADSLRALLEALPPSLDAALLAAVLDALGRGVRVQLTWQPAVEFELRVWERSEASAGLVNLFLLSPEPAEAPRPS